MSIPLTFKLISIISLVLGVVLVVVTYATLRSTGNAGNKANGTDISLGDLSDRIQSEFENATDLNFLDEAPEKVKTKIDEVMKITEGLENANLTSIIQLVRANWHRVKPFLKGAEGVSLATGIVQVVAAVILLRTPVESKYPAQSRHFSKFWISHYFFLGGILAVCSLVPWAFTSTSHSEKVGLLLLEKLKDIELGADSQHSNTELVRSLNMFYSVALLDGAVLLACGTISYCTAK